MKIQDYITSKINAGDYKLEESYISLGRNFRISIDGSDLIVTITMNNDVKLFIAWDCPDESLELDPAFDKIEPIVNGLCEQELQQLKLTDENKDLIYNRFKDQVIEF